jgi:hypothetical protein
MNDRFNVSLIIVMMVMAAVTVLHPDDRGNRGQSDASVYY